MEKIEVADQIYEEKSMALCEPNLPFSAFISAGSRNIKYHRHNHIELLYLIDGNSTALIQQETFSLKASDFLIVHSGEGHSFIMDNCRFLVIQFMPSVINPDYASLYENKYLLPFLQKQSSYPKHITLSGENKIVEMFTEILGDFNTKKPGYELNIKGNLYKIFAWLINNEYIVLPAVQGVDVTDIDNIAVLLQFVKNHYGEKITDDTASQITYMSYHHFCRVFKKVTGKTFVEYLNFVRLYEAEKLLVYTDTKITDIALAVGFSNTAYFSRVFKEKMGITPLVYRKQNSIKK
jgi:AraC-like DNA-binding protein